MDVEIKKLTEDTHGFEIGAAELIAELQKAIDESPESVRSTVFVDMEASVDWEVGVASLTIKRLRTTDEQAAAEARYAKIRAASKAEEEARQRREYERLKARFGV